jgi:hypothetical protein
MNKSEKIIVRTIAFLLAAVISASTFALFSSWAWSVLDPAQQEAIGAINTPWITARSDRASPVSGPDTASGNKTPKDGVLTSTVAHAPEFRLDSGGQRE